MKIFGASILLLVSAMPVTVQARAAGGFDGNWSVEVITEKGTCDRAYRWSVQIVSGRIGSVGDAATVASGSVDARGRVSAHFTRESDSVSASGSLSGGWGSGSWTSPSRQCSGRWRAERR